MRQALTQLVEKKLYPTKKEIEEESWTEAKYFFEEDDQEVFLKEFIGDLRKICRNYRAEINRLFKKLTIFFYGLPSVPQDLQRFISKEAIEEAEERAREIKKTLLEGSFILVPSFIYFNKEK